MTGELNPIVTAPPLASPIDATPPTRLGAYLRGPGRWLGWTAVAIIPLFIASVVIVDEVMVQNCLVGQRANASFFDRYIYDYQCLDRTAFVMGAVSYVFVLAFAVAIASAFTTLRQPLKRAPPPQASNRLQGIKDWFIRGDIDEADYQRMKQIAETADNPNGAGRVAAAAALLLQTFAIALLPLLALWFAFIGVFVDEMVWFTSYSDEFPIIVNWITGGLLGVGLIVFGFVRAASLRKYRTSYEREIGLRLERAEEELMRKARSHHGGPRALAVPAEETSSFRPYRPRRS
ncbi:MAG TPA: hypothetical protein VI818_05570 [Candidatus Thermoplasmatota archaeon]|nr:hypothetical protein [Candidatus Thermoplasmatota archaeon]